MCKPRNTWKCMTRSYQGNQKIEVTAEATGIRVRYDGPMWDRWVAMYASLLSIVSQWEGCGHDRKGQQKTRLRKQRMNTHFTGVGWRNPFFIIAFPQSSSAAVVALQQSPSHLLSLMHFEHSRAPILVVARCTTRCPNAIASSMREFRVDVC